MATLSSVPSGADLLVSALEKLDNTKLVQMGELLKTWARSGKAYRGQVFSLAEVEASLFLLAVRRGRQQPAAVRPPIGEPQRQPVSIASSAASQAAGTVSGSAPGDRDKHALVLKATPWPPKALLAAAAAAALSMGSLPVGAAQGATSMALIESLFELTRKTDPRNNTSSDDSGGNSICDAQVYTKEGTLVNAHKAILSAASPMLCCRFGGSFGDEVRSGKVVDASMFSEAVVCAVVQFIYIGACRISRVNLCEIYALADMWQLDFLQDNVLQRIQTLPPLVSLLALIDWDQDFGGESSARLTTALVNSAASGFESAARRLTPSPVLIVAPPAPEQSNITTTQFSVFGSSSDSRARGEHPQSSSTASGLSLAPPVDAEGWQFVRELHGALAMESPERISRLRGWLLGGSILADPVRNFLVHALTVVRSGSRADLGSLCTPQLKALLPDELVRDIVSELCSALGLEDETGDLHPWVAWTHMGAWGAGRFQLLWDLYLHLRKHRQETADAEAGSSAQSLLVPLNGGMTRFLPPLMEKGFAMSLTDLLIRDSDALSRWEELLQSPPGTWLMVDESVRLITRRLRHSRSLPSGVTIRTVLQILEQATQDIPSASVRISGHSAIQGIYDRHLDASGSRLGGCLEIFRQRCATSDPLVLRRWRRGRDGLRVSWQGVPPQMLEAAQWEWKIQRLTDDADVGVPLALSLDDSTDPAEIVQKWWLHAGSARFRAAEGASHVRIRTEQVAEVDISPHTDAVISWVQNGGCLAELVQAAGKELRATRHAVNLQICLLSETKIKKSLESEITVDTNVIDGPCHFAADVVASPHAIQEVHGAANTSAFAPAAAEAQVQSSAPTGVGQSELLQHASPTPCLPYKKAAAPEDNPTGSPAQPSLSEKRSLAVDAAERRLRALECNEREGPVQKEQFTLTPEEMEWLLRAPRPSLAQCPVAQLERLLDVVTEELGWRRLQDELPNVGQLTATPVALPAATGGTKRSFVETLGDSGG